jgi:hypothetical protein
LSSNEQLRALTIVACMHSCSIILGFSPTVCKHLYTQEYYSHTFENEWCRSTLGNKILGLFMKTILLCWNSYSCSFFSSLILLFLKFCLLVFGSVKIRSPLFNRKRSMSTLEGNWSFFYWIYSCGSTDWFSFDCQEILRFSFQLDSDISELIVVSYLLLWV